MDREHRHELKTNELADWIANIPDYLQQHGKVLAGGVFLVIAAVAVLFAWRLKGQTAFAEKAAAGTAILQAVQAEMPLDAKLASLPTGPDQPGSAEALQAAAAKLETTAQTAPDSSLAVLALIKQADTVRAILHYRSVVVGQDEIVQAANKASELYDRAIEEAAGLPNEAELVGMARLGKALCAEELGQHDKAAEIYRQVIDDEALAGTVLPARARLRLDALEDSQGTYTFPEAPATPAASAPTPGMLTPATPTPGTPTPGVATPPVIDVERIQAPPATDPVTPTPATPAGSPSGPSAESQGPGEDSTSGAEAEGDSASGPTGTADPK